MKYLILITALAFTSNSQANDEMKTCETIGSVAKVVMQHRQAGTTLKQLINDSDGNEIVYEMALDAYDRPRYTTPSIQQKTINEFENEWFLACLKQIRSQS